MSNELHTQWQRIAYAIREANLKQVDLVTATGATRSAVSQWINGQVATCPECQQQKSEYAAICPHCGFQKDSLRVSAVDVDIKFGNMVGLLVKLVLAATPAIVILVFIAALVASFIAAIR